MTQPNDTRLIYDNCSYTEKLKRTVGPGLYVLNTPNNDCGDCGKNVSMDPSLRYQKYGPNTCTLKTAVDDSSELQGLNYKSSKCNTDQYIPGTYSSKGNCDTNTFVNPRACFAPREDTRLSNPASTLRGTGHNRWEWLCTDPQEQALEEFDRIPVNYKMVSKDNHVPLIETPQDQSVFFPDKTEYDPMDKLNQWKVANNATNLYSPGYPYGSLNYNLECKKKMSI